MRTFPAAAIACAALTPALFAQQATFSSRAEAVRVDVSVTQRGRPVAGLTAADFEVFDNGVRQALLLVDTEDIPVDLVMALDTSGSVTGDRLEDLRGASQTALGFLTARDRAGLLTFSEEVTLRTPLTADVDALRAALDMPFAGGRTALIDAAYASLVQADGGAGRALAIMFSDGVDTASWLRAEDVIETAKRLDVVMFGISTGAPKRNVLDELADASGGDLIRIESTRELTAALRKLMTEFRQRYLLSYTPEGVARGGWHKIDVRVKRRGMSVKARAGYFSS
ncbi:MAG: VWA domain-containing protein [Acidobacteriota bacterium]|nr:VWA domain-containing protein [Acidobacteriota bacterium]